MFKQFTISLGLAICIALVAVLPALANGAADPPVPPDWVPPGWRYVQTCISNQTYVWWVPPDAVEWIQQNQDFPGVANLGGGLYWYWLEGEEYGWCTSPNPPTTAELVAGDTYDVWFNECGVYIPSAFVGGSAVLGHSAKPDGMRVSQTPCKLTFTDSAGEPISSFVASARYYFSLDRDQYNQYLEGDLGFYINDGTGWSECAASLVGVDLENDEFGRLACSSTGVLEFALAFK